MTLEVELIVACGGPEVKSVGRFVAASATPLG